MRTCRRNRKLIYYSNPTEIVVDRWGNEVEGYSEPIGIYVSISVDTGESVNKVFGKDLDYDRFISISLPTCDINEYSHLWIDIEPTEPYNYVVKRKAQTRRETRYAIKRVVNDD